MQNVVFSFVLPIAQSVLAIFTVDVQFAAIFMVGALVGKVCQTMQTQDLELIPQNFHEDKPIPSFPDGSEGAGKYVLDPVFCLVVPFNLEHNNYYNWRWIY